MKSRILSIFLVLLLGAALRSALAIGGVDTPPPPSGPHEVTFTQPKETKLENGLRVIVIERPGLPLLGAELVVRNGAEVDPDQLAGLATMTGTKEKPQPEPLQSEVRRLRSANRLPRKCPWWGSGAPF